MFSTNETATRALPGQSANGGYIHDRRAGERAVHVDLHLRDLLHLGEVHVDGAGDLGDARRHRLGHAVGPVLVAEAAEDLDVDRRSQAEVQDLRHHVGRHEVRLQRREVGGQFLLERHGLRAGDADELFAAAPTLFWTDPVTGVPDTIEGSHWNEAMAQANGLPTGTQAIG